MADQGVLSRDESVGDGKAGGVLHIDEPSSAGDDMTIDAVT